MEQMVGDGEGGIGGQAGFPLETWFWEMPLCTRWWTTATVLTSVLVQCQIVTPFQLFYSFRAVFFKSQVQPHGIPTQAGEAH
jgi:Derlin-2/3